MSRWPKLRKESTYQIRASHDLRGYTAHPEAALGLHEHGWNITCIFEHEINCHQGFGRDEVAIDEGWGRRIGELNGANLNEYMALPPTSENFALWLLYYWLPRLTEKEINFELSGVRVSKTQDGGAGRHSCEVMRTRGNLEGWMAFGGEVA